jgi:glycosyltransferase 2 family protein
VRSWKSWLKAGVALAIVTALFLTLEWRQTFRHLGSSSFPLVVLAFLLSLLAVLVSAWRWQRLLRVLLPHVTFTKALGFYWIGIFFSMVLPTNIGGDVVRLAMARRIGPMTHIFTSVIAERGSGLLVLAFFGIIALLLFPGAAEIVPLHGLIVAVLGLGIVAAPLTLPLASRGLGHLERRRWAQAGPGRKIAAKAAQLRGALATYLDAPGEIAVTFLLSLLFYVILFAGQSVAIHAVGGEIALHDVLVAAPLVVLVATLPISINGLGLSEAAFVILYAHMGVDAEVAFAAAILRRLVITLQALLGVVPWLHARKT